MPEHEKPELQKICYQPIGVIHSPYQTRKQAPRQAGLTQGVPAQVEIFPQWLQGLAGLQRYQRIIVIVHLHSDNPCSLTVKPHSSESERGVFATRAPCRPNAIGISVVPLLRIEGRILHIEDIDFIEGTPVLDIKPDYSHRKNH